MEKWLIELSLVRQLHPDLRPIVRSATRPRVERPDLIVVVHRE
jgi:hypothetical protein